MLNKFVGKLATSFFQKIVNVLLTFVAVLVSVVGMVNLHAKIYYLQFGPIEILPSRAYTFLTAVIESPLWEEFAFRVFPIQLVLCLGKVLGDQFARMFLPYIIILASIMFGWGHGGVQFVFCQGIAGLLLSRLYLKNNCSYWSIVAVHFLWNLTAFIIQK